jgi:tetratricopeptide (TPR) repeat protein
MAHNHNKIILLLMIKNESKIIERCIDNAIDSVDAICILDTGSRDNTVEICNNKLSSLNKPFKIGVEPFKNFGYNRTISFKLAQTLCQELNWNADLTYALAVDADMVIKSTPEFKDYKLTDAGYLVTQQNSKLKYYNIRFMRCNYNWNCIGVTHEYWNGIRGGKIPYELFYIYDKNDGGCKSDKFERDIRLLTEDLISDPNNPRTHFYLAQSYKDIQKYTEAISYYKKRIALGGWNEEIWYSHYQIGICYSKMGHNIKMESWLNRAWKYRPSRAEPLYFLTKYFREHSEHFKSYHYYLKGRAIPYPHTDTLFIEHSVYNGLFDYEKTILSYYVFNNNLSSGLFDIISYINKNIQFSINNVWNNIEHYVESLESTTYKGKYTRLNFPSFDEFNPSSLSVLTYNNTLNINVRYVNYIINNQGQYQIKSLDGIVKTKNGNIICDEGHINQINSINLMNEYIPIKYKSNIEGLEDIRLFTFKNELYFTSSTKSLTPDTKYRIAIGKYNTSQQLMDNIISIEPPTNTTCEKNWIYIPEDSLSEIHEGHNKMNFIYTWYPLQIGAVIDNKLVIHTTYSTPSFFKNFRGSSGIISYDNKIWCIVHFVKYSTPRKYYHSLIQLNSKNMKPERYSIPFCFRRVAIEYCLSIHIQNAELTCFFSENDSNPGMISIPLQNLLFADA